MKKWQNFLIEKAATEAKARLERSDKNELLNLFNCGIVIDLKKLKIKAIETGLKMLENSKRKGGKV